MLENQHTTTSVYQLRIHLRGVSPPIWRRVIVSAATTIADLHNIIQVAIGWEDIHLHEFTIRGYRYGVPRIGAVNDFAGPADLPLSAFALQYQERFAYVYDFTSHWLHDVRLEAILPGSANGDVETPRCIAGRGACPPEDSGPPERFMLLLDQHSPIDLNMLLEEELGDADFSQDRAAELAYEWLPWVQAFDRRQTNRRLQEMAYSG